MHQLRDTIRDFIVSHYLPGESRENLRDDTPLLSSGILDSLGTLGLVSFIAEQFGVELDVYDTSVEHFDRIEDIAQSIERKQVRQ
jgi:acyl carrier protein